MESERLQQFIAALDRQIANAPNEQAKRALIKARQDADSQLKMLQPYDKMGQLSGDLLNPDSPLYQEYAKFLQKTSPQMGVNSLLAPLMAGGMSYAGGQNIVAEKQKEFAGMRQDKINTGVQGFALGNISTGAGLLGQQGSLGLGIANLNEQKRQYEDQNSGWNQFWGTLGQFAGFVPSLLNGGGNMGGRATPQQPSVAGYGG